MFSCTINKMGFAFLFFSISFLNIHSLQAGEVHCSKFKSEWRKVDKVKCHPRDRCKTEVSSRRSTIHFGPGPSSPPPSIHFGPGPSAANPTIHFGPGPSGSANLQQLWPYTVR